MPIHARFGCAVDGGGTKTLAIVTDVSGNELARATAGPSNYRSGEIDRTIANITAAVTEAVALAGVALPLDALWVGLAGIDRPGARDRIAGHLDGLATTLRLTNDAELLFGALPNESGIVLIAGTGSIAFGKNREGTVARAGGWGYLIGDEGSGYDIGRLAVQAVAHAADGRGHDTVLLPMLLQHWSIDQPLQIIDTIYHDPDFRARIAECAHLVFEAAAAEDVIAGEILHDCAAELAAAVAAVAGTLDFTPDSGIPLVFAGTVLVRQMSYRLAILNELASYRIPIGKLEIVAEPALVAAQSLARSAMT